MTQPVSVTGKANMWASFNGWLQTNVPNTLGGGFTYNFDQALDPAVMPRVDVNEFKFFDPGDSAMGGMIFPANPLGVTQGKEQRAVVELNIRADGNQQANALQLVRQLRDWIMYALINAGVADSVTGAVLVPPIYILDGSSAQTGIICRVMTEVDNAIIENYYQPEAGQGLIHRFQILARLEWYEMR